MNYLTTNLSLSHPEASGFRKYKKQNKYVVSNPLLTLLIALLISVSSLAQDKGINYKALIKDDSGNLVTNQTISVKFTISAGIGQETVYEEEHPSAETDSNGIVILNIGEGTVISGVFSEIDWNILDGYINLRTNIDITGQSTYGNDFVKAIQFKAVPYAKTAKTIENQAFKVENNVMVPIDVNDDFVVGSDQLDNIGSGTNRLFFDRDRGAFRAGYANTDVWDNPNRGQNSFATGSNTKASGSSSVAMGRLTEATSQWATAFGDGSKATGLSSTAMGDNTEASGIVSTAMGNNTMASGSVSTAMGNNTIASSSSSTAMGSYNVDVPNSVLLVGNGNSVLRKNALTVLYNGNVGIGVDNPTAKLQLNGQIKFGYAAYIDVGTVNNFDVRINGSIRSTVDNEDNLGSSTFRYNTVYATNGTINTSDRRDKTNIAALGYGLKEVMQLQPVKFNWKNNPNTDKKLGLIAQDLYRVIPEVVSTHESLADGNNRSKTKRVEANRMGVYYSDLIPVLIKAIQEQQTIIDTQNSKLTNQDLKINNLTAEIGQFSAIEQRVKQLENALKTTAQ